MTYQIPADALDRCPPDPSPGSPCRTRGGRIRAPHPMRHDAAKDDR
jgi:hypothetical protein